MAWEVNLPAVALEADRLAEVSGAVLLVWGASLQSEVSGGAPEPEALGASLQVGVSVAGQ